MFGKNKREKMYLPPRQIREERYKEINDRDKKEMRVVAIVFFVLFVLIAFFFYQVFKNPSKPF